MIFQELFTTKQPSFATLSEWPEERPSSALSGKAMSGIASPLAALSLKLWAMRSNVLLIRLGVARNPVPKKFSQ